jgi:hypothetical protein
MTSRPEFEREEDELRALFGRSAEAPDRMQLVKLEARARDIPATAEKRGRSRLWAPILALVAGAFAVFAARGVFERGRSAQAPLASVTVPRAVAQNSAAVPRASAEDESTLPLGDEEVAVLTGESEADDGEPLAAIGDETATEDPLAALDPPSDDEIDQWLNATDAYLGGG